MPWDDLIEDAATLRLIEGGWREIEALAATVALHATPDNVERVIVLLSAMNLSMSVHVCPEPDEAGNVGDCKEYDLPESMKLLFIYGLMALREREQAKKENAS